MKKRILFTVLALCLTVSLLGGAVAESAGANIPYGKDLGDYRPLRDGYYAWIYTTAITSYKEVTERQLPLLVYGDHVYIRLEELSGVFEEVAFSLSGDKMSLSVPNRRLEMEKGRRAATWTVHGSASSAVFIEKELELSASPLTLNGEMWIPFTDTAALLGIGLCEGASDSLDYLLFMRYPMRDALNVLADLNDPGFRDALEYFPPDDPEALEKMSVGTGITITVHDFFDILSILRNLTATNVAPLIDRIASADMEDLAAASGFLWNLCNDSMNWATKVNPVKGSLIEKVGNGISYSILGLDALMLAVQYERISDRRDELAIDALQYFREEGRADAMLSVMKFAADDEIRILSSGAANYSLSKALKEKLPNFILETAKNSKKIGKTISLSPWEEVYKIGFAIVDNAVSAVSPDWGKTYDAMENYIVMLYGVLMEEDTKALLRESLDQFSNGKGGVEALENCILSAYLYIKTCAVTGSAGATAFDTEYEGRSFGDLALLINAYGSEDPGELLPDNVIDRATKLRQSEMINWAEPLCVYASGKVFRSDDKTPVTDAVVSFRWRDSECGYIKGTAGGAFEDVCVPLMIPHGGGFNMEYRTVEAEYTSPTVRGVDKKTTSTLLDTLKFETAHLGLSELRGRVVSADDGNPLKGVKVICESDGQRYTVKTGEDGCFAIEDIPGGDYTIYGDDPNYEKGGRVSYRIEDNSLAILFDDIELQPKQIDDLIRYIVYIRSKLQRDTYGSFATLGEVHRTEKLCATEEEYRAWKRSMEQYKYGAAGILGIAFVDFDDDGQAEMLTITAEYGRPDAGMAEDTYFFPVRLYGIRDSKVVLLSQIGAENCLYLSPDRLYEYQEIAYSLQEEFDGTLSLECSYQYDSLMSYTENAGMLFVLEGGELAKVSALNYRSDSRGPSARVQLCRVKLGGAIYTNEDYTLIRDVLNGTEEAFIVNP